MSENLAALNDDDIRDLFAYLQSLPPVKNRVPAPVDPPEDRSGDAPGAFARQPWRSSCCRSRQASRRRGGRWRCARPPTRREPPPRLCETRALRGRGGREVDARNRPFSPQYPLWTDGAAKRRWMQLPAGATIDATDADEWELPGRHEVLEGVRVRRPQGRDAVPLEDASDRWVVASYVWNEEQTDAVLAPEAGRAQACRSSARQVPQHPGPGRVRRLPRLARTEMLGFNALQLSTDRDPNALHGEPLAPEMLTLATLVDEGLLAPGAARARERAAAHRDRSPAERALLGYLAGNCGACHNRCGELSANAPVAGLRGRRWRTATRWPEA